MKIIRVQLQTSAWRLALGIVLLICISVPAFAQNRFLPGNENLPYALVPEVDAFTASEVLGTGYRFDSAWAGGPFIDLTATGKGVTITGFEMYFKGTVNRNVDIYWKAGSYVGSEFVAGDWTLLGTVNVTPGGDGTLTTVALGGVAIPAGETYGFHVWDGGTGGGDGPGLDIRWGGTSASDANLSLSSNYATGYEPFSGYGSSGWGWQGNVQYSEFDGPVQAVPTMSVWGLGILAALLGLIGFQVRRRRMR